MGSLASSTLIRNRARGGSGAGFLLSLLLATALTPVAVFGRPLDQAPLLGHGLAYAAMGLLFFGYLRSFGHRGAELRVQVVLAVWVLLFAAGAKALLRFTPLPPTAVPLTLLVLPIAAGLDRQVALAAGIVGAAVAATLMPFDLGLSLVLLAQGFAAVLALGRRTRRLGVLLAGATGGLAAATAHVGLELLLRGQLPSQDLASLTRSGLVGCVMGGLTGALLALGATPLIEQAAGGVTRGRLLDLANLDQALLRRIARDAPGTWAHSMAVANLADMAANAIGANALLARVGAYYHDLGKTTKPTYYIENLHSGQPSPHDTLPPETSANVIFGHCSEGVRLARQARLPEAVIDFIHMHHGDGLLEYFWERNREQGNPRQFAERDFCYPGVPPQSRETAIVSICDAVEAASRTLAHPVASAVETLVQHIIFRKLRLGQLDQSGLQVADLRAIANVLGESLLSERHRRIEYPWQRTTEADRANKRTI